VNSSSSSGSQGISPWGRFIAWRVNRATTGRIRVHGRPVSYSRGRTFLTMYREIFEEDAYRFTPGNPEGRILDVGANIGLATIYFKRLLPRARVVAIEPNPALAQLLRSNVADLDGVEILDKAVAPAPGKVRFLCDSGMGSRIADAESKNAIDVEAVTLESLVTDDVELVKLDVEGIETELLRSNNDWLSRVPRLFFEHHLREDEEDLLPEILLDLKKRGFRHLSAPATRMPPGFEGRHAFPPFIRQQNVWAWRVH